MPVCSNQEFKNPDEKSLKDLQISITGEDGVTRKIPALSKHWVKRTNLTNYISLVLAGGNIKNGADLEEWEYIAINFQNDMEFILSLHQHEFWSYLVYDETTLTSIRSFLKNATPFYLDLMSSIPQKLSEIYESIVNLIVRVICRMVTPKETADSWIDKDHLHELLYKKYILTIPMLLDLLMLIGDIEPSNCDTLSRIFDTLLKIVPDYKKDIELTLIFFKTAFRSIHTQTENEGCEGAGGGLLEDEQFETPFDDVALYTLDCACTLNMLLQMVPFTQSMCINIGLPQAIANLYDTTMTTLYRNISEINEQALSLTWLQQSRVNFLSAFRLITYSCVLAILSNPESCLEPSENFIAILTECLSEQAFVLDYQRFYPISCDMEIIKQACKELDHFKANFVIEGYEGAVKLKFNGTPTQSGNHSMNNCNESNKISLANANKDVPADAVSVINATVNNTRDIDLEVGMVLDCLPHLGTGFIRRILSRYDSTEEVIAAILENNLPPDLQQADQNEIYIPGDVQDQLLNETSIKRFNVFDGDPYDIMTQEKPQCVIKRGKGCPLDPKTTIELLDDKCDLAAIRDRYQEYTLVSDDDIDSDVDRNYQDEYDDSYDALLDSESRIKKSQQFKNVLAEVQDVSDDNDDDSSDNDSVNDANNDIDINGDVNDACNHNSVNFCENPEISRARWEKKFQNKTKANKGVESENDTDIKAEHSTHGRNYNVIGGPKGQGQAKDVLYNRRKKEAHKATRANHNRKMAAAFKRNRGIIP